MASALVPVTAAAAETELHATDEIDDVLSCSDSGCIQGHGLGAFMDLTRVDASYDGQRLRLSATVRERNSLTQPDFFLSLSGEGHADWIVDVDRADRNQTMIFDSSRTQLVDCADVVVSWSENSVVVSFDAGCLGYPQRLSIAALSVQTHEDGGSSWDWAPSEGNGFSGAGNYEPTAYLGIVSSFLPPAPVDYSPICEGAPAGSFPDATGTHAPAIDCVAYWGITTGKSDGTFAPSETLRIGQIASFLFRTMNVAGVDVPSEQEVADYYDDDNGSVHEYPLNALAEMGILPSDRRTIEPASYVSRAEMATLTYLMLFVSGVPEPTDVPDYFTDDDGHPLEVAINPMAKLGVTTGSGSGLFEPELTLNRAQMATFLSRALQLLSEI